jgi:hypothetical protein
MAERADAGERLPLRETSPADPPLADPPLADPPAASGRSFGTVGVGMSTMNVLAYAFTLLAAHRLGPSSYSVVASLLGVVIVANVGSLAVQATAARRIVTARTDAVPSARTSAALTRDTTAAAGLVGLLIGLVLLVAALPLDAVLHINDRLATLMVAPTCAALTLMGGYAGILQGRGQWGRLAVVYAATGLGRVVAGGAGLVIDDSARAAMIGVALGSVIPHVLGRILVAQATPSSSAADEPTRAAWWQMHVDRPVLREIWHNGHVLLAFFVLTNIDVLLARHLFDHHEAGIYAGGVIVSKACLFLPTFVLVVAFPSMAARASRAWLRPLLVVVGVGGCAVVGTLVLPSLAEQFAGGDAYHGLAHVAWVFALEGSVFAALQVVVYDAIASESPVTPVLWLGVLIAAIAALTIVGSVPALAGWLAVAAALTGAAMLLLTRRRSARAGPADAAAESSGG